MRGGGASEACGRTQQRDGQIDWRGIEVVKMWKWGGADLLLRRRVGNKEVEERKERRRGAQFSPADEKWTGKCLLGSPLPPLLLISSLSPSSPQPSPSLPPACL